MEDKVKKARNFRNYKVWQDAVAYATKVYKVTSKMPWFEKKGLCDQLQRSVVSISSNIAVGAAKPSDNEFAHFLDTALGSSFEVETQLLIARNVGYLKDANDNGIVSYEELLSELQEIEKQIITYETVNVKVCVTIEIIRNASVNVIVKVEKIHLLTVLNNC